MSMQNVIEQSHNTTHHIDQTMAYALSPDHGNDQVYFINLILLS